MRNLQGAALQGAAMRSPGTRLDGVTGTPVSSASGVRQGARVLAPVLGLRTGTVVEMHGGGKHCTVKWDDGGGTSGYIAMVLLA